MRPIPHALNLGAPEIYGQGTSGPGAQGSEVLDDVNMASMVGTLAQLGALATVMFCCRSCCVLINGYWVKWVRGNIIAHFCYDSQAEHIVLL